MGIFRVLLLNVLLVFALLGLVIITPPLVFVGYSHIMPLLYAPATTDSRSSMPLYKEYPWAQKHFEEYLSMRVLYYDFLGWRHPDFVGETINIQKGIRKTYRDIHTRKSEETFWFFGGSTTWGVGVSDDFTYPSLFSREHRVKSENFGEAGYVARQSLAYLANLLLHKSHAQLSNTRIFSYDGVNDVVFRCRSEVSGLGTSRENEIRRLFLEATSDNQWSFIRTFGQVIDLFEGLLRRLSSANLIIKSDRIYNCHTDAERALEVAETLVGSWVVADELAKSRGASFTAVLQPVAFLGNPIVDYLDLDSANDQVLAAQYEAVYPLIKGIARGANIDFLDLTDVYDNCADCYVDFCHVGPQAHHILVKKLIGHAQALRSQSV